MSTARLSLRTTAFALIAGVATLVAGHSIQTPSVTPAAMCALRADMFAPADEGQEWYDDGDPNTFADQMDKQYSMPNKQSSEEQEEACTS